VSATHVVTCGGEALLVYVQKPILALVAAKQNLFVALKVDEFQFKILVPTLPSSATSS
jgi:hypothetical protein